MKITIFAITPHDYGIPMFNVHNIDKANAIVAKLRERSPTWEFFAAEPIRNKHAVGRMHFVELVSPGETTPHHRSHSRVAAITTEFRTARADDNASQNLSCKNVP